MQEAPKEVAFCPHCGNAAPQTFLGNHMWQYVPEMKATYYTMTKCDTCCKLLVYQTDNVVLGPARVFSGYYFFLKDATLIWPQPLTLHPSVPTAIQECYK